MSSKAKWGLGLGALVLGVCVYDYFNPGYCRSAKSQYGLELKRCPEGELLQLVSVYAQGVSRTAAGNVSVTAEAAYTDNKADGERRARIRDFDVSLDLVASDGSETPLPPEAHSETDRAKGKTGRWQGLRSP